MSDDPHDRPSGKSAPPRVPRPPKAPKNPTSSSGDQPSDAGSPGSAGLTETTIRRTASGESQGSDFDLDWQHNIGSAQSLGSGGSGYSTGPSPLLEPGLSRVETVDLSRPSITPSTNIMDPNITTGGDLDSLDGQSVGSRSIGTGSKRSSVQSRHSKKMAAPGRPPKFATRPSHVNIQTVTTSTGTSSTSAAATANSGLDDSLRGIVEGTTDFRRSMRKSTLKQDQVAATPDISAVGVQSSATKTGWDRTKGYLINVSKVMVVTAFVAYGVFLNMQFNADAQEVGLFKAGAHPYHASSSGYASGKAGALSYQEKGGENTEETVTSDTEPDGEVATSDSSGDNDNDKWEDTMENEQRILDLKTVILEHQVSLPSDLKYNLSDSTSRANLNAQMKALQWLAETGALAISEQARDVQHEKMLQRYALAVLYYALGAEAPSQEDSEGGVTHVETSQGRSVNILTSENVHHSPPRGWIRRAKWLSDLSVCTWYGISCGEDEMVQKLNLTLNKLSGTLPTLELFQALRGSIQIFDISHNDIRGTLNLPEDMDSRESWPNLEVFHVNDNQLSGTVPFEWFEDSPITGINVAWNMLSGKLPVGLKDWKTLSSLYVSHNLFSGSLPILSNLPRLGK
jgi:hypothetical protein